MRTHASEPKRTPLPMHIQAALLALAASVPNPRSFRIVIANGECYFEDRPESEDTRPERVLSRHEVAELLQCTAWNIDKLRVRGVLAPVYTFEGSTRCIGFTADSVRSLLNGRVGHAAGRGEAHA